MSGETFRQLTRDDGLQWLNDRIGKTVHLSMSSAGLPLATDSEGMLQRWSERDLWAVVWFDELSDRSAADGSELGSFSVELGDLPVEFWQHDTSLRICLPDEVTISIVEQEERAAAPLSKEEKTDLAVQRMVDSLNRAALRSANGRQEEEPPRNQQPVNEVGMVRALVLSDLPEELRLAAVDAWIECGRTLGELGVDANGFDTTRPDLRVVAGGRPS